MAIRIRHEPDVGVFGEVATSIGAGERFLRERERADRLAAQRQALEEAQRERAARERQFAAQLAAQARESMLERQQRERLALGERQWRMQMEAMEQAARERAVKMASQGRWEEMEESDWRVFENVIDKAVAEGKCRYTPKQEAELAEIATQRTKTLTSPHYSFEEKRQLLDQLRRRRRMILPEPVRDKPLPLQAQVADIVAPAPSGGFFYRDPETGKLSHIPYQHTREYAMLQEAKMAEQAQLRNVEARYSMEEKKRQQEEANLRRQQEEYASIVSKLMDSYRRARDFTGKPLPMPSDEQIEAEARREFNLRQKVRQQFAPPSDALAAAEPPIGPAMEPTQTVVFPEEPEPAESVGEEWHDELPRPQRAVEDMSQDELVALAEAGDTEAQAEIERREKLSAAEREREERNRRRKAKEELKSAMRRGWLTVISQR